MWSLIFSLKRLVNVSWFRLSEQQIRRFVHLRFRRCGCHYHGNERRNQAPSNRSDGRLDYFITVKRRCQPASQRTAFVRSIRIAQRRASAADFRHVFPLKSSVLGRAFIHERRSRGRGEEGHVKTGQRWTWGGKGVLQSRVLWFLIISFLLSQYMVRVVVVRPSYQFFCYPVGLQYYFSLSVTDTIAIHVYRIIAVRSVICIENDGVLSVIIKRLLTYLLTLTSDIIKTLSSTETAECNSHFRLSYYSYSMCCATTVISDSLN